MDILYLILGFLIFFCLRSFIYYLRLIFRYTRKIIKDGVFYEGERISTEIRRITSIKVLHNLSFTNRRDLMIFCLSTYSVSIKNDDGSVSQIQVQSVEPFYRLFIKNTKHNKLWLIREFSRIPTSDKRANKFYVATKHDYYNLIGTGIISFVSIIIFVSFL